MGLSDDLDFDETTEKPRFELVMQPRDKDGKPFGKQRSVKTNSGFKLWRFMLNNQGKPKPKTKGKAPKSGKKMRYQEVLPVGDRADKLAQEAADYAEKKQQERVKEEN
tara:strand:- start:29 stop:352 length:324 start_codon:yes stop_codon:yes gene_type:complete